jgi:ribosomal protein S21
MKALELALKEVKKIWQKLIILHQWRN